MLKAKLKYWSLGYFQKKALLVAKLWFYSHRVCLIAFVSIASLLIKLKFLAKKKPGVLNNFYFYKI